MLACVCLDEKSVCESVKERRCIRTHVSLCVYVRACDIVNVCVSMRESVCECVCVFIC